MTTRPSSCPGCLEPKHIMQKYLHFYVEGLIYLEKDGKIVETKLRFSLATNCTDNIGSPLNDLIKATGKRYNKR